MPKIGTPKPPPSTKFHAKCAPVEIQALLVKNQAAFSSKRPPETRPEPRRFADRLQSAPAQRAVAAMAQPRPFFSKKSSEITPRKSLSS
jgi:hypothetical protein